MFQTKYSWYGIGALILLLFGIAEQARGAVIFQSERLAFETANPGLMIEDFEKVNIPTGEVFGFPGEPLINNATNNTYFSTGDIRSGIEFQISGDSNFRVSNNYFINTTKSILAAQAAADILINLNQV